MRILIYGLNYFPEVVGIGKYTGEMALWLAQQGHKVTVITAPPYYPYWKVQPPYRTWHYHKEDIGGVQVYRCPLWVPERPSAFKRIFHLLSFSFFSFPVFLREVFHGPDVVMTIAPSFLCSLTAMLVRPFKKSRWWIHVQDFEFDAALSLGLLPKHGATHILKNVEKWVMTRFDRASSISEAMVGQLHTKGLKKNACVLFPNWTDLAMFPEKLDAKALRRNWSIPEESHVVLYSGNMGGKQGLDVIPWMARRTQEAQSPILFLLAGDGAMRPYLEGMAEKHALKNIRFLQLQPMEKYLELLSIADVHLVLQRGGVGDTVMPSKLGAIFAMGGATLATAEPGTNLYQLLHGQGLGAIAATDSPEALLNGLLDLLKDKPRQMEYKKKTRDYAVKMLNKEMILRRFEKSLLELCNEP